jgi:hypothetical protein
VPGKSNIGNSQVYLRDGGWRRHDATGIKVSWLWQLWSRNRNDDIQGVFSHETALALYELSDVMPGKLHMTVPHGFDRSAAIPPVLVLHRNNVPQVEARLQIRAKAIGVDFGRLRKQVAFDCFPTRIFPSGSDEAGFVLKSGYALELRFLHARATKDIDLNSRIRRDSNVNVRRTKAQIAGAPLELCIANVTRLL